MNVNANFNPFIPLKVIQLLHLNILTHLYIFILFVKITYSHLEITISLEMRVKNFYDDTCHIFGHFSLKGVTNGF